MQIANLLDPEMHERLRWVAWSALGEVLVGLTPAARLRISELIADQLVQLGGRVT